MVMLKHLCPCCGRHCYLSEPHCERGAEYKETGVIPPRREKSDRTRTSDTKKSEYKKKYHILDQDNKLIWNLRDMGQTIRELAEGKGSQSRVLIILHEDGKITQKDLTERLGIQPGSASEVIIKLENAGLIARTQSEEDRRTSDLQLTEAGKLKAAEEFEQRKQRHVEMFSCLSDEDKADFLMLLEKVNHDWRHRYGKKNGEHSDDDHRRKSER